jgi:hypothetical protein
MHHHDVFDARVVLQLLHVIWEHVIGTDGFDFFLFGISVPRCEIDVLARDALNEQNIGTLGGANQTSGVVTVASENEDPTIWFGRKAIGNRVFEISVFGRKRLNTDAVILKNFPPPLRRRAARQECQRRLIRLLSP